MGTPVERRRWRVSAKPMPREAGVTRHHAMVEFGFAMEVGIYGREDRGEGGQ